MLSELASPHIRCCLSAILLDLMKSTAVDESLSSMNQQFCSRENQRLQMLQQNEKSTQKALILILGLHQGCQTIYNHRVQKLNTTNESDIGIEFEENLPHQEGIISEIYQRPDRNYFQEPKGLDSLVDTSKIAQMFLPKQTNIDKILKLIQHIVLKGLHLSITVKKKFKQDI